MTTSTSGRMQLNALRDRLKRAVKTRISRTRTAFVRTFRSYDADQLVAALRKAGVTGSDTLLVHANFTQDNGFKGGPLDLVNALARVVEPDGNLLMVSIPFRGSGYDYLVKNKPFNVRKTISLMGLVTETFRRRAGTARSLHPTHPVLAVGPDAEWLVAGHEACREPCGADTPFDKFRQRRGKILFFDVPFGAITFFHHVEDVLRDRLPFPVYHERLFEAPVVDAAGENRVVETYTFNPAVTRRADKLERRMAEEGKLHHGRIGNSRFILVDAEDVVASFTAMVAAGNYPYDWTGHVEQSVQ